MKIPPQSAHVLLGLLFLLLGVSGEAQDARRRFGFEGDGYSFLFPATKREVYARLLSTRIKGTFRTYEDLFRYISEHTGIRIEQDRIGPLDSLGVGTGLLPEVLRGEPSVLTALQDCLCGSYISGGDYPVADYCVYEGRIVICRAGRIAWASMSVKTLPERVLCFMSGRSHSGEEALFQDVRRIRAVLTRKPPKPPERATLGEHLDYFREHARTSIYLGQFVDSLVEGLATQLVEVSGVVNTWDEYLNLVLRPLGLEYYYTCTVFVVPQGDGVALQQEVAERYEIVRRVLEASIDLGVATIRLNSVVARIREDAGIPVYVHSSIWQANESFAFKQGHNSVHEIIEQLARDWEEWDVIDGAIYLFPDPVE